MYTGGVTNGDKEIFVKWRLEFSDAFVQQRIIIMTEIYICSNQF